MLGELQDYAAPQRGGGSIESALRRRGRVAPRTCGCRGDGKPNPELRISSSEVGSVNRTCFYSRRHSWKCFPGGAHVLMPTVNRVFPGE